MDLDPLHRLAYNWFNYLLLLLIYLTHFEFFDRKTFGLPLSFVKNSIVRNYVKQHCSLPLSHTKLVTQLVLIHVKHRQALLPGFQVSLHFGWSDQLTRSLVSPTHLHPFHYNSRSYPNSRQTIVKLTAALHQQAFEKRTVQHARIHNLNSIINSKKNVTLYYPQLGMPNGFPNLTHLLAA